MTTSNRVTRIAERIKRSSGQNFTVQQTAGARIDAESEPETKTMRITAGADEQLTDDELAWVIAHEAAHIKHKDHERKRTEFERVDRETDEAARKIDQRLAEDGRGTLTRLVAQAASAVVGGILLGVHRQFTSQQHEKEADAEASRIAREAGFDPAAGANALAKMHGGHLPYHTLKQEFTSSHPSPASRATKILEEGGASTPTPTAGAENLSSPQSAPVETEECDCCDGDDEWCNCSCHEECDCTDDCDPECGCDCHFECDCDDDCGPDCDCECHEECDCCDGDDERCNCECHS